MADARDYLIPEPGAASKQLADLRIPDRGYEIAGLQPLPVNRLHRWAGRPTSPANPRSTAGRPPGDPESVKARAEVLQRNQKVSDLMKNWDPIGAEWKQKMNNRNTDKRSKPVAVSESALREITSELRWKFYKLLSRGTRSAEEHKAVLESPPNFGEMLDIHGQYVPFQEAVFSYLDGKLKEERSRDESILSRFRPVDSDREKDLRDRFMLRSNGTYEAQDSDLPSFVEDKKLRKTLVDIYNARLQRLREKRLPQLRETIQPIEPYSRPDFQGGGV